MMRVLFGLLLALLVAVPPLFGLAVTVGTAVASQPPVLAFAFGLITWPHIARRLRKWWKGMTK
jgi:ABC-type dipeptide/oligopeptide/nickel transport system permease subunit